MFLTEDHVYLLISLEPRPFHCTDTFQSREEDALHAAASVTRTLSSSAVLVLTRVCGEMLRNERSEGVSSLKTSATNFVFLMGTCHAEKKFPDRQAKSENHDSLRGDTETDRPLVMQLLSLWTGSQRVVTLKPCLPALSSCEPFLHLTKHLKTCWNSSKPCWCVCSQRWASACS